MKILHVVHWPKSGIVNLLYNILDEPVQKTYLKNYVLFFKEDKETTKRFDSITEQTYAFTSSEYTFNFIDKFRKCIKEVNPQLIHVHSFLPHLYSVMARVDIPIVRTIHSDYPYFYSNRMKNVVKRKIELKLCKKTQNIVSVSQSLSDSLIKVFPGVEIKTIFNGVKIKDLKGDRSTVRKELNIPENGLVFVSMGRVEHQKGFDILIDSFIEALENQDDLYLLLLGEGSKYQELYNKVENKRLNQKIIFLGYQNGPYKYLDSADIYITSARYEGYGLAVAEAQASGLPVIGFSVSGVKDIVRNGVTGLIINNIDKESLSNLIQESVARIEELKQMGKAGEEFVKNNYAIEQTAQKYISEYKRMVNE